MSHWGLANGDAAAGAMSARDRRDTAAALLAVAACGALLSLTKIFDKDIFWHLQAGLVAREQHRLLLEQNVFSSLHADAPWLNPYWIFQRVAALLYTWGGWEALGAMRILAVALLGALLWRLARGSGAAAWPAAACAMIALAVMRFRFAERPHLFSYLFFALVVLALERSRQGDRRGLFWLPGLFALWSNVHPELIMGLALFGPVAAGAWLRRRAHPGSPGTHPARIAAFGALSAAATLLNPVTYRVLTYPFQHIGVRDIVPLTEYDPSTPGLVPLFWAFLALAAAAAVVCFRRGDRERALTLVAFAGPALLHVRLIPFCVIAALPAVAQALSLPRREPGGAWARRARRLALPLATSGFLLWGLAFDRSLPYRFGIGLDETEVPEAAARAILVNRLPGRLYNDYDDGGFLLFRLYPTLGVFQDGRIPAYPREFLAGLFSGEVAEERLQALLDRSGVNTALIAILGIGDAGFTADRWGLVFWDDRWCVLLRRAPENEELLRRLEYRFFVPGGAGDTPADPGARRALLAEMERNQRERLVPSASLGQKIAQQRAATAQAR